MELAKGKVPVLAGAGGYNTCEVIECARELARLDASGILSVTPYYNKPTQEGLYQHFKAIAEAVDLPDYSVQRAGAHGREHRTGNRGATGANPQHRGNQGSFRKCRANGHDLELRAGRISGAFRRRRANAAVARDWRTRRDLCSVQRNSGGDEATDATGAGRRFRGRARDSPAVSSR